MPPFLGASVAWNPPHALELAGTVCLLVLASLAWVPLLKRQARRHALLMQSQLARERILAELGRKLATALTVEEAARTIADAASELFGWDAFYLTRYSAGHDRMEPVINIDTIGGRRVDVASGYAAGKPTPMAREIVEHGAKLLLRGKSPAGSNPVLAPFGDKTRQSASLMFVPIRDSSRIIGLLSVQSYMARFYDEGRLKSLQAVADHCGGALERIRTRQELQRSYDELESRVAQRTAELTEANQKLHKIKEELLKAQEELERRIQERTAQLSDAVASLEREIADRRLAESRARSFSHLGQKLSAASSSAAAAQAVLDVADELLGWDAAYLQLYTPDYRYTAPVLLFDVVDGKRTQVFGSYREITPRDKRIIEYGAEWVRGPVASSQPAFVSFGVRSRPTLSRLFAPIRSGTKVIRSISVQSYTEEAYQQEDLAVLQTLADFCSATLERLQAQESLRKSEERFSKAFRSSPMPMSLNTLDKGVWLDMNESMLRFFGYTREEMLGHTSLEMGIWHDPEERMRMLRQLQESKSVRDFSCRIRVKDGALREVLLSVERLDFGDEAVILVIVHDMTDRLNLEAQLRHAQKMEAVGQLAAGVAHDFNNILTIIQGHGDLLLTAPDLPETLRPSLTQIIGAASQAGSLTKQLLTFSRKQVIQLSHLNLNEVVHGATQMLRRLLREAITLQLECGPAALPIYADAGMIEQIIVNLALNARDAMPQGGRLTIKTEAVEVDAAYAQQRPEARPGAFACLTVADTGTGMDQATLHRIFEPFFTTKEVGKGTGLGLATTYAIVKHHQGWIEVASQPGAGSVFKTFLPLCPQPAPSQDAPGPAKASPGGNETILVVEDEASLRELVCTLLRHYGYRVLQASHGKEALEVWRAKSGEIDLLLTDMMMPGGISGWELAGKLQADRPGLKVIYTSGYSVDLLERGGEFGQGIHFLPKPYQPHVLAKTVRDCLDE
jgi:PAS domain S-box-containing protein